MENCGNIFDVKNRTVRDLSCGFNITLHFQYCSDDLFRCNPQTRYTPPKTNIAPKDDGWKTTFLLKWSLLKRHSFIFRRGNILEVTTSTTTLGRLDEATSLALLTKRLKAKHVLGIKKTRQTVKLRRLFWGLLEGFVGIAKLQGT